MILLYPYKDDGNDGFELRHSIRSMCKHADITGCVVIGDRPSWLNAEHIPAQDIPGRKEWSIVKKVMLCPYDEVLYCHDDIFALEPIEWYFYHSGLLRDQRAGQKHAGRIHAVMKKHPTGLMFDCHTPMLVNVPAYTLAHSECDWQTREYLSKSVCGNHYNLAARYHDDCKLRHKHHYIQSHWRFFSTNNATAKLVGLEKMYPEPSPYETPL